MTSNLMKTTLVRAFTALLLTAATLIALPASAQTNTPRFRAIVLAERGDQHEAFVAAAIPWLTETAQQDHFSVDAFKNPDQFSKPFLAKYQVIIQLNYPPYRWS